MIYLIRSKVLAYVAPLHKRYRIFAIDDNFQLYIVPEDESPKIDLSSDYSRENCEILHLDGTTSPTVLESKDIYGEANQDITEIARKVAIGQASQGFFKSMLVNKLKDGTTVQFKMEQSLDLRENNEILFKIFQKNPGRTREEILQERDDQLLANELDRQSKAAKAAEEWAKLKPIGKIDFWDQTVTDHNPHQWTIYLPVTYVKYAEERIQDGIKDSEFDEFLDKLRANAISYTDQPEGTRVDRPLCIRKMGVKEKEEKIFGLIPWSTDYVEIIFE